MGRQDRFHRSFPGFWCLSLFCCALFLFLLLDVRCDPKACDDGDPCTVNSCLGLCFTERIEGCCQTSSDCGSKICHQAVCVQNQCQHNPYLDSTVCDDQNACTLADVCSGGVCVGAALNCSLSSCMATSCDPLLGCVSTTQVDGTPCEHDNLCAQTKTCHGGTCVASDALDCTHMDDQCGVGDCVDGKCVKVPSPDRTLCDDGLHCSIGDSCLNGQCLGRERICSDNDPCTLNTCVESINSCASVPLQLVRANVCEVSCEIDSDCLHPYSDWGFTDNIQCRDGSCVEIASDPSLAFRFLEYEMEPCPGANWYRMAMFFAIDTAVQMYDEETRYRVAYQESDFHGSFPVGFPYDVDDIQSFPNQERGFTTFTMHTECRDLSVNCFQFVNRYYAFVVQMSDCVHSGSIWQHCVPNAVTAGVFFNLSVVDCPVDNYYSVEAQIEGELTVQNPSVRLHEIVTLRLTVTEGFEPWMTDIRMCVAKVGNLEACVLNNSTQACPNTGCYGWGDRESEALEFSMDLMQGGQTTAAAAVASNHFATCRHHENYDKSDKCQYPDLAPDCDTDGFSVGLDAVDSLYHGSELFVVFDVKFMGHYCGRRRLDSNAHRRVSYVRVSSV